MTSLADLVLAAQERCDRVNGPMTHDEWVRLVNGSAGALYRLLVSTYDDYNLSTYAFTLAGGVGGNILQVGAGSGVPSFDKLRHISRVVSPVGGGSSASYAPVLRADSLMEFDQLSVAGLVPYFGNLTQRVKYFLYGATIEIRPAASAAGSYLLYFVPAFQQLVADTDTIDGTWMATSGIDEYIVLDAAAKAMVKEESLDTAQMLMADRERVKVEILQQFAQRDDNQPGRIQDVKGARTGAWSGFGGWR